MEKQILPQTDHDLLITMAATSKIGIADLKSDIAEVNTNIAELKGTVSSQHTGFDMRIKVLENISISVNVPESMKKLQLHDEFINDYKATHKERMLVWGYFTGIAALLISLFAALGNYGKLLGR